MECRAQIVPSTGGNPTADDHWCGSGEMPLWKECSWQWLRYLKDIGEQFLQRQETWSSLPSYINAPQKDNGKLRVVDSQWQAEGTWGPLGSLSLQWKNKQLRNTFRTWYLKLQNSGDISILSRIGGSRTCCHLWVYLLLMVYCRVSSLSRKYLLSLLCIEYDFADSRSTILEFMQLLTFKYLTKISQLS